MQVSTYVVSKCTTGDFNTRLDMKPCDIAKVFQQETLIRDQTLNLYLKIAICYTPFYIKMIATLEKRSDINKLRLNISRCNVLYFIKKRFKIKFLYINTNPRRNK